LGERPDVVERRCKGDQAEAGDASVSGHEADNAAERRRLTDGTASIGAQSGDGGPRSYARGRAPGRAAGNAPRIARIAHRTVGGVLVGRAHGELVAVGLAQYHSAGSFKPRYRGAIVRRNKVLQNL